MRAQPRLKDLGRWSSGGTPPRSVTRFWNGQLPWISAKDIDRTRMRDATAFITRDAASSYSRVAPVESILTIVRGMALAHGLPVVITDREVAFNQDLRALTVDRPYVPRFVYYALLGSRYRLDAHIDRAAHGTARLVDSAFLERLYMPSRGDQLRIAEFLDGEAERIEVMLGELEHGLGLVDEERSAVVEDLTHARSVPLKYTLVRIEQGWSPDCDVTLAEPGAWGVLKAGAPNHGAFRPEEHKALPSDTEPVLRLEVQPGDVLMSRANTRALVGSAAVVESTGGWRLMLCDKLYRLVPRADRYRPRYLVAALASRRVRDQIEMATAGASASMQNITQELVRALQVPCPALEEQAQAEAELEVDSRRRETVLAYFQTLEQRLVEYRDALITEAVSGKLDVTRLSESQLDESAHAAVEAERPEVLSA